MDRRTRKREKGRAEKRGMEEAGLGPVLITLAFSNLAQRGAGITGMSALGHCESLEGSMGTRLITARLHHCALSLNMLNIHLTYTAWQFFMA